MRDIVSHAFLLLPLLLPNVIEELNHQHQVLWRYGTRVLTDFFIDLDRQSNGGGAGLDVLPSDVGL